MGYLLSAILVHDTASRFHDTLALLAFCANHNKVLTMGCSSSQMAQSGKRKHHNDLVRMDSCASIDGNDACLMPGGYKSKTLDVLDAQQPTVSADAYRRSRGSKLGRADSTTQI